MSQSGTDHANAVKQAARAGDIAEQALQIFKGDSSTPSTGPIGEVIERVSKASKSLSRTQQLSPDAFREVLGSANNLLKDALSVIRAESALAERHAQAVEAIARSLALLYPLARAYGVVAPSIQAPPRQSSMPKEVPKDIENRRRAQRAVLQAEVGFETANNFFTGFTEDISEGGVFIATYQLRPMGTEIELSFTLPDGYIVNAVGIVRWLRDPRDEEHGAPPGMGIQFTKLSTEDINAVQAFVNARAPLFYDE